MSPRIDVETSRTDALRSLEAEVAVLIRKVRRVLVARARAVHPELQRSSYVMLGHIRDHGPIRASAMCAVFDIDKGAVSRQAQHLIDLGLVDRSPDPEDGRATLLSISDEGLRRLESVAEMRRNVLGERLADWSAEELAAFGAMLHRYNEALGAGGDLGE